MASFEVRVVNDKQKGVSGVRVRLEFTSPTRGMSAEEYTDSDGSANFDDYEEGEIRVYIDSSNYGTYDYRDGECITVTKYCRDHLSWVPASGTAIDNRGHTRCGEIPGEVLVLVAEAGSLCPITPSYYS